MLGNNSACRNRRCDEGLYNPKSPFLCEACFRRQVGDAILEVVTMIEWSYEGCVDDIKRLLTHVEVN